MNIRDRLMSRASVAVMAAFAPKPEGGADQSKVGQMERVEDAGGGGGDDLPIDGLSAEEQAQLTALREGGADVPADPVGDDGEPAGEGDIEHAGAAADDGDEVDDEGGEPAADGAPAAADGQAAAGDQAPRKSPKTISYGRHKKEQARLQKKVDELNAALGTEREQRTRLSERTQMLLEAINQKPAAAAPAPAPAASKEPEDPEPDAGQDPIGHIQWENRQMRAELNRLSTGVQKREQETEAQAAERADYERYTGEINRAAAADPNFADAFTHLRETRYRELGFIFANIDVEDPEQCKLLSPEQARALEQKIQETFYNEQMLVARQSWQSRRPINQTVMNLARSRQWKPKEAAPAGGAAAAAPSAAAPAGGAAPAPARRNGNGAAPAAAAAPSVTDQLAAIRDGAAASRSLGDAGGSPGAIIDEKRLIEMGDDEFEEFLAMNKRGVDAALGKPARAQ